MNRLMKLSEIKIKPSFSETTPREEKMEECRNNYVTHGEQDRYVVVDHTNTLIDGYIMYLVLKENNVDEAKVKISNKRKKCWERINTREFPIPKYRTRMTTYVYGVHPNSKCKKEFIWRIPQAWDEFENELVVGDIIYCITKFGCSPVIVTKIKKLDKCPVDFRVRRVAYKKIIRNMGERR